MDDVTHIINGMDIEGVLNGGADPRRSTSSAMGY